MARTSDAARADRVDVLRLPGFLPFRLATLSNRISRAISRLYAERHALTIAEWRCMAILAESPELSANEVAERGALDKVAVSRAVARLIEMGRLERRFAPEDRRRSVLSLSPQGLTIYSEIVPLAMALETRLLARLDANDKATLDRLLDRLESIEIESLSD